LHEGDKVIKTSTRLVIEGNWHYSYENSALASLTEAARTMMQVRDDQKFDAFNPDSVTIEDKFTKDQFNIKF
jgi:hypothetical protein